MFTWKEPGSRPSVALLKVPAGPSSSAHGCSAAGTSEAAPSARAAASDCSGVSNTTPGASFRPVSFSCSPPQGRPWVRMLPGCGASAECASKNASISS